MSSFAIRPYRSKDEGEVITLWEECGLIVPHNNPWRDIERKRQVDPDLFFIGKLGGRLVATCMAGYDGHRGWINYLAVAKDCRRQGLATIMMKHAESMLREAGCPKLNLLVRTTNREVIAFYEAIGFEVDEVVSMGKRLIPDTPDADGADPESSEFRLH